LTPYVRQVDLTHLSIGSSDRWGVFFADVFDLDEDILERVDRLLHPFAARSVVHCIAGTLNDPEGVLLASIDDRERAVGYIELLGVRPDRRGQGVARDLVNCAEEILAARGVSTVLWSGNSPCYAWPGIDLRYTAGLLAAESLGYAEINLAHDMSLDLTDAARRGAFTDCQAVTGGRASLGDLGADRRLSEVGIVVLRSGGSGDGPDDERRLLAWITSEFGEGWRLEVAETLERARAGRIAGAYVARNHEEILGFAAYGAQRRRLFGPMGTTAAARGTGIGSRLLRECLAEQSVAGLGRVDIGWVGPTRFYSKVVGARVSRVYRRSAKRISPAQPGRDCGH
jgi:GNAT superfamily N-acetyltransferase